MTSPLEGVAKGADRLERAVAYLTAAITEMREEGVAPTLEGMAAMLVRLRDLDDDLWEARAILGEMAYPLMGGQDRNVAGLGVFRRQHGWTRKDWDHDDLLPRVVARAQDERRMDPESGTPLETEGQAVARVLRECAGFAYWKVRELAVRGIDADEFCRRERKRLGVSVPRRQG